MNLLFAISAHGFGHGALSIPVIETLARLRPSLRCVLHTRLPADWLRGRLSVPCRRTGSGHDFGMRMTSPMDVDAAASARAYVRVNDDWDALVADERELLRRHAPDLVVSNISFLALEAARLEGIPAVTLCPFNWLDVFRAYCADAPDTAQIQDRMHRAYASAQLHIRPEPSLPMREDWPVAPVGPICSRGRAQRQRLRQRLGLGGETLVLVAFGGIAGWADWGFIRPQPDIHWLVSADCPVRRADVSHADVTGLAFSDLLASVDLVLTKPGYATFTEVAAAGVPMISLARPGWPEWPYLKVFAGRHIGFAAIDRSALGDDRLLAAIRRLGRDPATRPTPADGTPAAARLILGRADAS